jgi:hypothetical protein
MGSTCVKAPMKALQFKLTNEADVYIAIHLQYLPNLDG